MFPRSDCYPNAWYAVGVYPSIYTVTGNYIICSGSATQYTTTNIPAGTSVVSWQSSSNIVIDNTGRATPSVSGFGAGWVQATYSGACGRGVTQRKTVWVGPYSSSDIVISGPSSVCPGQTIYFSVGYLEGVSNYQWSWPSNWTYLGG